ncbi:MAG: hypothetical protein OYM47_20635 [Gemmatimonadota bacterium]|nr:hypothetical protein [Gemmatimonadota bacterium]
MSLPLCVVTDPDGQMAQDGSRYHGGFYIREILAHAGIPFDEVERPLSGLDGSRVVLLPWHMPLSGAERTLLAEFVKSGGALIGLGGMSGLDDVFGAADRGEMADGYMQVAAKDHPVTSRFNSSLHCFGGRRIKAADGTALARVMGASDGVVEHRAGNGLAIAVGPDVVRSIVQIQQGHPIPPAVGPTRIDVIQGLALDLDRDRSPVPGEEENLVFLEPIADEFRELIIKAVLYACRECGVALPVLWYWPENLPAIAHMSHDSDGGDEALGWSLLRLTQEVDIRTTWCNMAGHYQPAFYRAIEDYGSEAALHYDAQTWQTASDDQKPDAAHLKWGYDELASQLKTVTEAAGRPVTTNKNHTLRWQGRLEFFRWCERLGITLEQSRGPNTPFTNGFPFGGCHPWFPIDDEAPGGPPIDVLEVNLTVQDIHKRCSTRLAHCFADRAFDHHGIAHFLFHPAHVGDPAVRGGLREIVGYTRDKGMAWWTAARIDAWERARRTVRFGLRDNGTYEVSADTDLKGATVLQLDVEGDTRGDAVERYGFPFRAFTMDLEPGTRVELPGG